MKRLQSMFILDYKICSLCSSFLSKRTNEQHKVFTDLEKQTLYVFNEI